MNDEQINIQAWNNADADDDADADGADTDA